MDHVRVNMADRLEEADHLDRVFADLLEGHLSDARILQVIYVKVNVEVANQIAVGFVLCIFISVGRHVYATVIEPFPHLRNLVHMLEDVPGELAAREADTHFNLIEFFSF
ncbi:hypothetical protein D3C76_947920 [compost metagenome]